VENVNALGGVGARSVAQQCNPETPDRRLRRERPIYKKKILMEN